MAVFAYRAIDSARTPMNGTIVADSPHAAREQLRGRGAVAIESVTAHQPRNALSWRSRRHPKTKIVSLIRELSTLLGVGIPILDALDTLARQERGRFKSVVLLLRDRVAAGISLAEAMREQPGVFDDLCVTITEVGENSGTLDEVLQRLAEFKEKSANFQNKVVNTLLYPAIVLVMALGVGVFLMTMVVPNLLASLVAEGRSLPWATRVVKGGSDLLLGYWWAFLLGAIATWLLMRIGLRTQRGRRAWHRVQLRLPVIGPMLHKQAIVRIAIVISTLLKSGVVFARALSVTQRTTPNLVLRDALWRCEEAINAGADLGPALERTRAFPPVVVQVFAVGQQSGRLEEMLERLAGDYDQQVTIASQRLATLLEPLLILGLVVLVGFIAFATVLPMLEAADVF